MRQPAKAVGFCGALVCRVETEDQYLHAGVWGFQEFDNLEGIQTRAMRFLLGVNLVFPILALFGDMAWAMPKCRTWISQVRLWNRLRQVENTRLAGTLCYNNNWSFDIYEIFVWVG